MQNKGQQIDKKFTNRAWAKMTLLLDQEMPVAAPPRKRRIAGWWWLLAGLGIGAGTAALWFSSIKEPVPSIRVERSIVPAQNSEHEESRAPIAGNDGTMVRTAPEEAIPPLQTSTIPIAATEEKDAQAISPPAPQKIDLAIIENSQSGITPLDKNNDTKAETRTAFPTMKLASLPLTQLPDRQPVLPLAVAEQPSGKPRPEFFAYAGALASPVSGGNGLAGGMLVSFHLKKPRLSVETGLGYSYIRQPLSILAPEEAAPTTSNPGMDENQQVIYGFEDLTAKATRLESSYLLATQDMGLHYAEVPVHLAFQASPKWQFVAGLHVLVLLESAPGFTSGGLLDAAGAGLADMANGSPFSNGISSSTLRVPLSKIDIQMSAGVRYRLDRRLSLGLQYQMGTVDVVKSNGASDFHRLVRFSIFHHFGR